MPYATPSAALLRYDSRRVGQLCADDGSQVSASALLSDPVLLELLDDASGMIDSALLRGGRYTQDDLRSLSDADAKLLTRLTCDLCYGLLVSRRGYTSTELNALAPAYAGSLALLDRLGNGELIFNVPGVVAAGKPVRAVIDRRLQLISSARRLYGDITVNPSNPGNPTDFGDS